MRRLSRLLVLAMVGISLTTALLIGGLAISASDRSTRARAEAEMHALLGRQALRLEDKIGQISRFTGYLARRIDQETDLAALSASPTTRAATEQTLSRLLVEAMQAASAPSAWVHYDPKVIGATLHVSHFSRGGQIERTQPFDIRASGHDRDEWFAAVVDGDQQSHWTAPYLWGEWGGEIVTMSRRLEKGGVVYGATGSEVFLSDLFAEFGRLQFYRSGHLLLLSPSMQVLFHPRSKARRLTEIARGFSAIESNLKDTTESQGTLRVTADGIDRLLAYQRLSNGWIVALDAEVDDVFAQHAELTRQILWLSLVGTGLAIALAWWGGRQLFRMLDRLTGSLEQANEALAERNREVLAQARELELLAHRDPLTGLTSRRAGLEFLQQAIARSQSGHGPLTIAYVDINDLKQVNDQYGHAEGDRLIQQIAVAIRESLREGDLAARIGGDEFLVILPDCDKADAERVFVLIRQRLADEAGRYPFPLSFSVGFEQAVDPTGALSVEEFISRADARMYTAKQARKATDTSR